MSNKGGFQLEFVSISRVINHIAFYNFECSHWWKIYIKKNPLQDLPSSLIAVISTNESTRIITGHVIYNPAYTYKFQLKTTYVGELMTKKSIKETNHQEEIH